MDISVIIALAVMGVCLTLALVNVHVERKRAISREQELIAAFLAKDGKDYSDAIEALKTTPKDRQKNLLIENDLAINAAKLEHKQGIAVR